MKKKACTILIMLITGSLLLSGCSAGFLSLETLLRPPRTHGRELELTQACSEQLGENIVFKNPPAGEHNSSITMFDLDADEVEEAVVFFSRRTENAAAVSIAVFKLQSGKWTLKGTFAGMGSSVYSLEFCDLEGDGFNEIIVGWTLFQNKTNKMLTVYSTGAADGNFIVRAVANEPYNMMRTIDLFEDGRKEIVYVYLDTATEGQTCTAKMLRRQDNGIMALVCETQLDRGIIAFSSINVDREQPKSPLRIYIDAYKSEKQMITEVLVWNSTTEEFDTPLADSITHTNIVTMRNSIDAKDVNGDGFVEIPTRVILPGGIPGRQPSTGNTSLDGILSLVGNADDNSFYLTKWSRFIDGELTTAMYSATNIMGGYNFKYPPEWIDKYTIEEAPETGVWTFRKWNSESGKAGVGIFRLMALTQDEWVDEYRKKGYILIANGEKLSYYCLITKEGRDEGITSEMLANYIFY